MRKIIGVVLLVLLCVFTVSAQEESLEPQLVEVMAEDGLVLMGDFYAASDSQAPSVLLFHMFRSNRLAWSPLIPPLLEAGYNVLAVDLRGHGETGGDIDWTVAQNDTQLWLNWLREQPTVADDQVSMIGASVGTILALNGCAADEQCLTVIALSPVEVTGLQTDEAVSTGLSERSILLVATLYDGNSPDVARHMLEITDGEIALHLYKVATHGTDMLNRRNPTTNTSVVKLILLWLEDHLPQDE